MRKIIYVVTCYCKVGILDKNLKYVWRWRKVCKYRYTRKVDAVKMFTRVNKEVKHGKAVLRLERGGQKRVKR